MRKKYIFGKKLYISILTMIVVLLTTVATTFAWVGVFANSTFEQFEFKIMASHLSEYNIEISSDGINFSDSISFDEIKKQILLNWGYDESQLHSNDYINEQFAGLRIDQCTTVPNMAGNKIKSLGNFTDIRGRQTNKLFKFDFYLSVAKSYDIDSSSDFHLEAFLNENMLSGSTKHYTLQNIYTYPEEFINPYNSLIENGLFSLPNGVRTVEGNESITSPRVDSSAAARLAFEKYPVVAKGHPEQYSTESQPNSAVIYQNGYDYPIYDENTDTYSFGSILPDDYNLAVGYYNSTEYKYYYYKVKSVSVPSEILDTRSVLGSVPDQKINKQNNKLINPDDTGEQIGVNQMMKIRVYFWFEGWDSDCFPVINMSPVRISINLKMKNEE